MMIIPGLKKKPRDLIESVLAKINRVLEQYKQDILLADFNLKTNVLWVSLEPKPGLHLEIAALIHHCVPESRLVAWQPRQR